MQNATWIDLRRKSKVRYAADQRIARLIGRVLQGVAIFALSFGAGMAIYCLTWLVLG